MTKPYLRPMLALLGLCLVAACQSAQVRGQSLLVDGEATIPTQGEQWLYGSAEASIALRQDWDAVASFIETAAKQTPPRSVVLAPDVPSETPRFVACGGKPLAAVFDADETLIWNLGAMEAFSRSGKGFTLLTWLDWEKTGAGKAVATPGVLAALARIRAAGVEVIVNTNRTGMNAKGAIATLKAAGIGDFVEGETLFLRGASGSGKDGRRMEVAKNYCVLAMAGDQLGDISDQFNADDLSVPARKRLANSAEFDTLWGQGWFILPNPVYGPSIEGSYDDVFPAETRWRPAPEDVPLTN